MKTCTQCNLSYDGSKNFCQHCGNELKEEHKLDARTAARKNVLEEKLKADPLNVGLLHEYASFLAENGVYKTAVEVLQKLLAINENDTKASRLIFHTYIVLEDYNAAREIGETLLADQPDDEGILSGMAKIFYESGNYDKAITYSESALAADASSIDALYCKALAKLKKNDLEEALLLFDALIKAGKTDDITNLYSGIHQSLAGNHESAVNLLTGVLSKDDTMLPDDQDVDRGAAHLCRSLLLTNASTSEIEEWFSIIDFKSFQNHIHVLDEQSLAETIYGLLKKYVYEWAVMTRKVVNIFTSKFMIKPQVCITGSAKDKLAAAWIMLAGKMVDQGLRNEAKDSLGHASGLLSAYSEYRAEFDEVSKRLQQSVRRRNLKTAMILGAVAATIAIIVAGITIKSRFGENRAWEVAVEENTPEAYQHFFNMFPLGRFADKAKNNIVFSDPRDNQIYRKIKIGNQWWMAENLNATTYNDGSEIINMDSRQNWGTLKTGAYCWYDNEPNNRGIYGALYNWYAVNTGKLCPEGWRVPTDDDWTRLADYLGGEEIAGRKLKATGTLQTGDGLWHIPNEEATNETGFSALPGGYRTQNGEFNLIGDIGFWWSATEVHQNCALYRVLSYEKKSVDQSHFDREMLLDLVMGRNPHPIIVDAFRNPTDGSFDVENVKLFLQNFGQLEPGIREQWLRMEETIREQSHPNYGLSVRCLKE